MTDETKAMLVQYSVFSLAEFHSDMPLAVV